MLSRLWIDLDSGAIESVAGTPPDTSAVDFALELDTSLGSMPMPPNALPLAASSSSIGKAAGVASAADLDCGDANEIPLQPTEEDLVDASTVLVVKTGDNELFVLGNFTYPSPMGMTGPPPIEFDWTSPCVQDFECP